MTERDREMGTDYDESMLLAGSRQLIHRADTNLEPRSVTDEISRTADALLSATSAVLNPSPDVAGCPAAVARLTIPTVLRAYADAEHHFGEGIAQRVDYGTGVEYDAVCVCGASWGEDGCTERDRLLAVAAEIENTQAVDNPVERGMIEA